MPKPIDVKAADLFATRIWTARLDALSDSFPRWIELAKRLREAHPQPAGGSNRRGWNGDKRLFARPELASLQDAARNVFAAAFAEMRCGFASPGSFALEAWLNISDPGGYNTVHTHPGVLLSGVFYLATPPGSGSLVLRDPRPGVALGPFIGKGPNCRQVIKLRPVPGLLCVFPNWLEHDVEENEGAESRVSIAMNAMPAGAGAAGPGSG